MAKKLIDELLEITSQKAATDLHLCVGTKPIIRIAGKLHMIEEFEEITAELTESVAKEYLDKNKFELLKTQNAVDVSYSKSELGRFRCNFYRQRGTIAVAIRSLPHIVPDIDKIGVPSIVKQMVDRKKGIVLVTGVTGSGKSTTLASIIKYLNETKSLHINTIEDPIEYLHNHKKSLVTQKEIGFDATDFSSALRATLREDPDVIMLGEMRDLETISIALTGAETGHLLLSTLHTSSAAQSIERIMDAFKSDPYGHTRSQLASVLEGIISQQLIPRKDGKGLVLACEILNVTPAIRTLIRENKTHQISSIIQHSSKDGMISMERQVAKLVVDGIVDIEEAKYRVSDQALFERYVSLGKEYPDKQEDF